MTALAIVGPLAAAVPDRRPPTRCGVAGAARGRRGIARRRRRPDRRRRGGALRCRATRSPGAPAQAPRRTLDGRARDGGRARERPGATLRCRLRGRGEGQGALLRRDVLLLRRDADPRARGRLDIAARLLGADRALIVPAHRLLVRTRRRPAGGHACLFVHPHRRPRALRGDLRPDHADGHERDLRHPGSGRCGRHPGGPPAPRGRGRQVSPDAPAGLAPGRDGGTHPRLGPPALGHARRRRRDPDDPGISSCRKKCSWWSASSAASP